MPQTDSTGAGLLEPPKPTRQDFVSDQTVRWCPGCGDYSILAQVQRVMPELGIPKQNIVFVSGIGCSAVPYGLDFVFLPNSLVGEYWPLVRP